MNFVADTHALIWWFTDSPKLSQKASQIFEQCERGESIIFVPSIVVAELLSIFDKKRIAFNFKNLFNTDFRGSFNRHNNIRFSAWIHLNLSSRFTESSQEIDFGSRCQGTALSIGLCALRG